MTEMVAIDSANTITFFKKFSNLLKENQTKVKIAFEVSLPGAILGLVTGANDPIFLFNSMTISFCAQATN